MVDVTDSKSVGGNTVWVRVPPPAPRRSKVRFAPTSFYACGTKRRHPPAPLLLLSNRDPLRWARSWGHPAGASFPEISVFIVPSTSGQSPLCSGVFFSPNKSAVRLRPNVSCESYNRRLPGKNGPCNANGLLEEIFQLAIKRFFFHMLPVVFLRLPAAHRLVKSLRLYGGMTGEIQSFRALIFGPICRESK